MPPNRCGRGLNLKTNEQNTQETNDTTREKFLTFFLDNEEYGLEILKVQEIIGVMPITPVPRTQEYVRGVLNLRGNVIPVIDLRTKFGMPSIPDSEQTCIIVVQVLEGENAVAKYREIMGATNPANAAAGTIRKDFAESIEANSVHGSDSPENAAIEISFFFAGCEIVG